MYCGNCGTRMPEGSRFCSYCGNELAFAPDGGSDEREKREEPAAGSLPETRPDAELEVEKPKEPGASAETASGPKARRLDERHHYLLTIMIGGAVLGVVTTLFTMFSTSAVNQAFGRDGWEIEVAFSLGRSAITTASLIPNWILHIVGILLVIIGYSGSTKREKTFNTVRTAVILAAEAVFALVMLAFAKQIAGLYASDIYIANSAPMVRAYAGAVLLAAGPMAVAGILIKKNLIITSIIYAAYSTLTATIAAALILAVYFGKLPVFWLGAFSGLIQPAQYILPNVGEWRALKKE